MLVFVFVLVFVFKLVLFVFDWCDWLYSFGIWVYWCDVCGLVVLFGVVNVDVLLILCCDIVVC